MCEASTRSTPKGDTPTLAIQFLKAGSVASLTLQATLRAARQVRCESSEPPSEGCVPRAVGSSLSSVGEREGTVPEPRTSPTTPVTAGGHNSVAKFHTLGYTCLCDRLPCEGEVDASPSVPPVACRGLGEAFLDPKRGRVRRSEVAWHAANFRLVPEAWELR